MDLDNRPRVMVLLHIGTFMIKKKNNKIKKNIYIEREKITYLGKFMIK